MESFVSQRMLFFQSLKETLIHLTSQWFLQQTSVISKKGRLTGNGVQEPQEDGKNTTLQEGRLDGATEGIRVATSVNDEFVDDEEQRGGAKGPVAPFVRGARKGADQPRDDHDLVGEDRDQERGPWHAGGEEQVREQQRRGDEPVNVAHVKDLAGPRGPDDVAGADELGLDGHLAQVGAHRPVGYAGDGRDARGDVVEQAVRLRLGHGHAHEDEGRDTHHRADCEIPVRRADGDGEVGVWANHIVDVQCLISRHVDGLPH